MISVNWQWVAGIGLIGVSLIALLIWAGPALMMWAADRLWSPANRSQEPAEPDQQAERGADEPPPPGAVAWVADITQAMGAAASEDVLAALEAGATRDKARELRIASLEQTP
jgi:hypothetical protein